MKMLMIDSNRDIGNAAFEEQLERHEKTEANQCCSK